MHRFKYKILFVLIESICCFILLAGCKALSGGAYELAYSREEIDTISIVLIAEGYDPPTLEYETLHVVTNNEEFLGEFSKIQYERILWGSPPYLNTNDYAIMIQYNNGCTEFIGYGAQDVVFEGRYFFGKHYCDEQEFLNFLGKYVTLK